MATDKDPRTYVRIHDGMPDHPKVDGLSDAAFRLLVTMWCWCSRHLTDGLIPGATWLKRGTLRSRGELVAAGLVDLTQDGAVRMHDYTDHQRTAEEVSLLREARREAGRKGGLAKANGVASAKANAKQNGSKSVPETDTDTEVLTDVSTQSASSTLDGFAEFWMAYPKKVGKPAAEKSWKKAIKAGADPSQLPLIASRYAERMQKTGTDRQFICNPATWLNQERYNDEPAPAAAPVQRRYPPTEIPDWLDPNDPVAYSRWMTEAMR